jgi:hypothetical protein
MGKLTRSAGRVLGAGVLVLAAAGVLVSAGARIANAQPARTSTIANACDEIFAAFANLAKLHDGLKRDVAISVAQFTQAASTASPTVKSEVNTLIADLKADAASGQINRPQIVADGDAIDAACAAQATSPSGAPATGGGSTAGVQDAALFGVGGAAVLAGICVLGLARRNRPRDSPGHG